MESNRRFRIHLDMSPDMLNYPDLFKRVFKRRVENLKKDICAWIDFEIKKRGFDPAKWERLTQANLGEFWVQLTIDWWDTFVDKENDNGEAKNT